MEGIVKVAIGSFGVGSMLAGSSPLPGSVGLLGTVYTGGVAGAVELVVPEVSPLFGELTMLGYTTVCILADAVLVEKRFSRVRIAVLRFEDCDNATHKASGSC